MSHDQLNIVHITNNYTPFNGGVVHAIDAIVDGLKANGHHSTIITLDFLGSHHNDPSHIYRIPSIFKGKIKQKHIAIPWRMHTHLKKYIHKNTPDIIHVHHPFLLGPACLKIAQANGIPVIFTHHTLYEAYLHYFKIPSHITKHITNSLVTRFCNNVDAIIVPSEWMKQYLLDRQVHKNITVIPSPIDNAFLPQSLPQKMSLQKRKIRLLVVSRFEKEKNLEEILYICHLLPRHSYTLVFAGFGSQEKQLQHIAFCTHSLSRDDVHFIIDPSRPTIDQLYNWSDLFLFTSRTDTQGLVLAEAMAHGTPVVALDGPGQRDIVIHTYNGFLVSDAQEAALCIKNYATLAQNEIKNLQSHAHATAQQYSKEILIKKLVAKYTELVDTTLSKS